MHFFCALEMTGNLLCDMGISQLGPTARAQAVFRCGATANPGPTLRLSRICCVEHGNHGTGESVRMATMGIIAW